MDHARIYSQAWGAIRASLNEVSFNDIKVIAGLAGLDMCTLAHLDQKPNQGATKGQLLTAIDGALNTLSESARVKFLTIVLEELLRRQPNVQDRLEETLSRHGWGMVGSTLIQLKVYDPADLAQVPEAPRVDLLKASQRYRDGDLGGAISAACGAVDTVTSGVYAALGLGDPIKASFQERCNRSLEARQILPAIEQQLRELGWDDAAIKPLAQNYKGALNQGAFVMQTLRSKMGDVHGTKPILKPMVFDSLKWAEVFVQTLCSD
ncbi:hypothetical protein [Chromobacterium amazonense]|uniref:hypothetical protein n=1 Tax=Chromobacterium amazonense TaxID=1382803 RepID=UPI003F78FE15